MSDLPEEPESGEPGPEEGGGGPDDPDAPQRGWIDPDDRIWRHPSEVAPAPGDVPVRLPPPPRHRYRGAIMVLIGAAAVVAVAAFVVVLLSPASQNPQTTATTGTAGSPLSTLAGPQNAVPAAAQPAGRAMVELQAQTPHGTVKLIGVAVAEGGLVVTTASLLNGVQHIDVVGPSGKLEQASVVGTDGPSDVALVNVPVNVPVAPFADDAAVNNGSPDLLLSLVPAGGAAVALHAGAGAVASVGAGIDAGPASGMALISSAPAPAVETAGEPLLNASGEVLGILCDPDPSGAGPVSFLPTQLVVGVADDLRSGNKVVHGWLGVEGTDQPGGGAKVVGVQANSPAAHGGLQAGQVIVGVNSMPVRTMAELRSRLYVLAPGTSVSLSLQGGSGTRVVNLTLGRSS
ncbi:MAG TPA: PDZ domain-containing protein [Acidimicrobiales bacterium]|nr:PDZ domain-containing protein [Acidimicrobiales bacterium]